MGGVPSVGVFLRDPSPYLQVFRSKTTENFEWLGRQARPKVEPDISRLPVFERRIAQPLMGPRTDRLTSMPYLGFEPGTIGATAVFPNYYTA